MIHSNGDDQGENGSLFDSQDCVIFVDDGPGDTTVRPCPPELLASATAQREKILRWQKPEKPEHPNGPGANEPQ